MVNRITTFNAFQTGVANIQRQRAEIDRLQTQVSTGKRVLSAGDDPVAASRIASTKNNLLSIESSTRAISDSQNSMEIIESTLGASSEMLDRAREILVGAGNSSYSASERKSLADELRSIRTRLLDIANQADGTGGFVFGGNGTNAQGGKPFVENGTGVVFNGIGSDRYILPDFQYPKAFDGQPTWTNAPSGNGVFTTGSGTTVSMGAWIDAGQVVNPQQVTGSDYTISFTSPSEFVINRTAAGATPAATLGPMTYSAGGPIIVDGLKVVIQGNPATGDEFTIAPSSRTLNVFDWMERTARELETLGRTDAQIAQTVSFGLRDLNSSTQAIQSTRSRAGSALKTLDENAISQAARKLEGNRQLASDEDVDFVEAVSAFEAKQLNLQAALKSYASVQKLSLFDYIS